MSCTNDLCLENQTATRADHATLFVSLELSRKKWLVTSLSPGSDKMSKHTVAGGDGDALLALLRRLAAKALARVGKPVNIVSIHEAGLDGFSVHRLLEKNGVASYVVDPASIAVPRRARRAKTDSIDGETLLRTLLAWQRGEPRVCSMVVPPTPEEEDRRRISRERKVLLEERIKHVNRIKGLLASQGITSYQPLRRAIGTSASTNCRRSTDGRCRRVLSRKSSARSSEWRCCCAKSSRWRKRATRWYARTAPRRRPCS